MVTPPEPYAARLDIDYPEKLDRVTTFFRLIWAIPIVIILSLLSASASSTVTTVTETGDTVSQVTSTGGGIAGGLFLATMLMILFRGAVPTLVVRLRPRTEPLLDPGRRLPGPPH